MLDSMFTKGNARVKHTFVYGSTLTRVRGVMRSTGWVIVIAVSVAAVAAAGRAVLGRLAGEPGVPTPPRGSFDTWPAVPPAPGRQVPNGSRVLAGG